MEVDKGTAFVYAYMALPCRVLIMRHSDEPEQDPHHVEMMQLGKELNSKFFSEPVNSETLMTRAHYSAVYAWTFLCNGYTLFDKYDEERYREMLVSDFEKVLTLHNELLKPREALATESTAPVEVAAEVLQKSLVSLHTDYHKLYEWAKKIGHNIPDAPCLQDSSFEASDARKILGIQEPASTNSTPSSMTVVVPTRAHLFPDTLRVEDKLDYVNNRQQIEGLLLHINSDGKVKVHLIPSCETTVCDHMKTTTEMKFGCCMPSHDLFERGTRARLW